MIKFYGVSELVQACIIDQIKGTDLIVRDCDLNVYSDEEATKAAHKEVLDSIWAFRLDFLRPHFKLQMTDRQWEVTKKAFEKVTESLCEDMAPIYLALLKDENDFVEAAIDADKRGYFLSGYDFEEHEIEVDGVTYFAYRN